MDRLNLILLTGGTGYVGGRLLQSLEAVGYRLRCMARRPDELRGRVGSNTEEVFGDCFDKASLTDALAGVHTAYYLVHSMGSTGSFEEKDRQAASNFAEAARETNVRRIIYLGGLGEGALLRKLLFGLSDASVAKPAGIMAIGCGERGALLICFSVVLGLAGVGAIRIRCRSAMLWISGALRNLSIIGGCALGQK